MMAATENGLPVGLCDQALAQSCGLLSPRGDRTWPPVHEQGTQNGCREVRFGQLGRVCLTGAARQCPLTWP